MQFRSQGEGVSSLQELEWADRFAEGPQELLRETSEPSSRWSHSGTDAERMASVREDLASLREKEAFVEKWIEQLTNDARAARPR